MLEIYCLCLLFILTIIVVLKIRREYDMTQNLYEWFHDDITWCGNECSYIECDRNLQNRLTKGGLYSAAMFKDTETCPLYEKQIKTNKKGDA